MKFTYSGYIVPYVRVGRERFTKRARRYFASRDAIRWHLTHVAAKKGLERLSGPFEAIIVIHRRTKRGDIDNLAKAILDAGEGPLYKDDNKCKRLTVELYHHERPASDDVFTLELREINK